MMKKALWKLWRRRYPFTFQISQWSHLPIVPKEGLQAIHKLIPDLIFLYIEMPWINGFEMLDCLGDNINFAVVFVTAYDQYTIKAFKTKAIDYLLKPVDKDDLIACAENIRNNKSNASQSTLKDIKTLIETSRSYDRILLHSIYTIEILAKEEIVYCQADSNYSYVFTNDNRKITASKSLNTFEELLDPSIFTRIHRSYVVNLNYIKQFSTADGYEILLKDGTKLPVSRRKKDQLLERLMNNSGTLT
ncbi:MAG: two-component system LytT family response regulator [Saprospiraceae bacterium]|jgi:two-component system LytT family response regulator